MSLRLKAICVLVVLALSNCKTYPELIVGPVIQSSTSSAVSADLLLEPFMNKDAKTLFKAWHFIHGKEYDYNTELGLQKYKTFKQNLKAMEEHNRSGKSWTQGLNHLSDMTDAEVRKYYNLNPIDVAKFESNLRAHTTEMVSDPLYNARPQVDYRSSMTPVRNQGACGSCWAFTTQAVLEGSFTKWHGQKVEHFSTQQSVDCDPKNNGCNGGWYDGAFSYFQTKSLVYESGYKYTATKGVCKYSPGMVGDTKVKITGYNSFIKNSADNTGFNAQLAKGPVAIAVDANGDWYRYKSGVMDIVCNTRPNHAVVLVGYKCDAADNCNKGGCHFIIRNSWGATWGSDGHINIKDNGEDKSSCLVEKFAYSPKAFIK